MMLPSRLGCPLSLKTPDMGNTGFLTFWYICLGIECAYSQRPSVVSFSPIASAKSFCLKPFSSLAFLIHSPKVTGSR